MWGRTLISASLLVVSSLHQSSANLDSSEPQSREVFNSPTFQNGFPQQQGNPQFYPPLQYPGPMQGGFSSYLNGGPFLPGGLQYPGVLPQAFPGLQPPVMCPLDLIYVEAPIHPICQDYYQNRQIMPNSLQSPQYVGNAMGLPSSMRLLPQRPYPSPIIPYPRASPYMAYPTEMPLLQPPILPLSPPCPPEAYKLLGMRPPLPQVGFNMFPPGNSYQQQIPFLQGSFASRPPFILPNSFPFPQQNGYAANVLPLAQSYPPTSTLLNAFPYLVVAKPQYSFIPNRMQFPYSANSLQFPYSANSLQFPYSANSLQFPYSANSLRFPYSANSLQFPYSANSLQFPYSANSLQFPYSANSLQFPYSANALQFPYSANSMQYQYNSNPYSGNALYLQSPYVPIIPGDQVYNGTKSLL